MIHTYRGYLIKPHKEFPTSVVIATEGKGGKIPDILQGLFTSLGTAKVEIDKYLATKIKVTSNDQESK